MRRALLVAWLAALGCGRDPQCDSIAGAYARAVAAAETCDPAAEDPCGAIVRASLGDDSSVCDVVAIDPAQQATVNDFLGRFAAASCPLGPAPPCPGVATSAFECRAGEGAGGVPTCQRKRS
jgi:hypothetical protein